MNKRNDLVAKLLIIFFLFINIVPNFQANAYVTLLNMLGYVLVIMLNMTVTLRSGISVREFLAYGLIFLNCVIPLLTGHVTLFNRYLSLSILPISYLLSVSFSKIGKVYVLKQSCKMVVGVTVINLIISMFHVIQRPSVMRGINATSEESFSNMRKGIGGYDLVYFWTLILVFFVYKLMFEKRKKFEHNACCGVALLLGVATILLSNFLTAFLILGIAFSILLFLWLMQRKKYILAVLYVVFFVLLLVADQYLMDFFAPIILELVPGGTTALRIETYREIGIIQALLSEFFADRMPLIQLSVQSAIETRYMGGMLYLKKNLLDSIGQHSYLFDTMALYGVGVFILNVVLLMFPIMEQRRKHKKVLYIVEFVSIMIMLLLNNATASIALAYFVFVPSLGQEDSV